MKETVFTVLWSFIRTKREFKFLVDFLNYQSFAMKVCTPRTKKKVYVTNVLTVLKRPDSYSNVLAVTQTT
jgi:hypothetical protein